MSKFKLITLLLLVIFMQAQVTDISQDALRPPGSPLLSGDGSMPIFALPTRPPAVVPIFDYNPNVVGNGPSQTNDTLGSTGATLALSCNLNNISGNSLACTGATLTASSAPSLTSVSAFTDGAKLADFGTAGGDEFVAASNSVLDVGTDDFAVEVVALFNDNAGALVGKKDTTTGTDAGWTLYQSSSTMAAFRVGDGTSSTIAAVTTAGTVAASGIVHVLCFWKHNIANGAQCFANGSAGSAVTTATITGSKNNSMTFAIGANESTETGTDGGSDVGTVRVWRCSGCFNIANYQAIASEKAARLWGAYPTIATGAAAPTTMTRASAAYVDIESSGVRRLQQVFNNGPRISCRYELAGGERKCGYLAEPTTTNLVLQSEDLNTTWIKTGATVTVNSHAAPNGATTADSLLTGGTGTQQATQSVTSAASTTYTHSFWVKDRNDSGGPTWIVSTGPTAGTCVAPAAFGAWVNVKTCTIGNVGTGTASAEDWGNGWCRVIHTFTTIGGATSCPPGYRIVDSNGATTWTGATAVGVILWGHEFEAYPTATSYQPTTTASVSRSGDDLRFAATGNATASGTMDVEYLCRSFDNGSWNLGIIGSGALDSYWLESNATGDRARSRGFVTSTQWDIGGVSEDVTDGEAHSMRVAYETNNIELWFDGLSLGTDTSAAMQVIDGSDTIRIGQDEAAGRQPACLIARVRIWDRRVTP